MVGRRFRSDWTALRYYGAEKLSSCNGDNEADKVEVAVAMAD